MRIGDTVYSRIPLQGGGSQRYLSICHVVCEMPRQVFDVRLRPGTMPRPWVELALLLGGETIIIVGMDGATGNIPQRGKHDDDAQHNDCCNAAYSISTMMATRPVQH